MKISVGLDCDSNGNIKEAIIASLLQTPRRFMTLLLRTWAEHGLPISSWPNNLSAF
jgi:hypothetical protein